MRRLLCLGFNKANCEPGAWEVQTHRSQRRQRDLRALRGAGELQLARAGRTWQVPATTTVAKSALELAGSGQRAGAAAGEAQKVLWLLWPSHKSQPREKSPITPNSRRESQGGRHRGGEPLDRRAWRPTATEPHGYTEGLFCRGPSFLSASGVSRFFRNAR